MAERGSPVSANPFRDGSSSTPSITGGRPPSAYLDDPAAAPENAREREFDPYVAYGTVHPPPPATLGFSRKDGYSPARTSSPPPTAWAGPSHSAHGHSTSSRSQSTSSAGFGHQAHESASSHDLLLAAFGRSGSMPATPAMPSGPLNSSSGDILTPPPRNPQRLVKAAQMSENDDDLRDSATSSTYSMADDAPFEDPSPLRPALEVRNLPDGVSVNSDISREPSRRQ
ncbi:hypothetical protein WOLCODRAFT_60852 [Wolfiporia cocos MD-104 SS10]|uniref:Uncharacterized protein n=1 Tax=Wolfiporia cocos (strain MD-104) TaxID=742152 RepID=A0A2H3IUM0_WOLCO|nr:hypothetical protein WOLCODRAFT_60852 [Wolfiporia cocos MD-104 SS10]